MQIEWQRFVAAVEAVVTLYSLLNHYLPMSKNRKIAFAAMPKDGFPLVNLYFMKRKFTEPLEWSNP